MPSHYHYHHRRPSNQRAISEMPPASPYPGVNPYADFPEEVGTPSLYPYSNAAQPPFTPFDGASDVGTNLPVPVSAVTTAPSTGGSGGLSSLLSGLNLSNIDVKGIIERMGGIDGLVANVGKVQKVMQGFQQLAPMMSLFAGMFGKKGKGASSNKTTDFKNSSYGYTPRKRRSSSAARRRSGSRRPSSGGRKRRRS
ncbi:MAG: hypothetical protein ACQEXX_27600 [Bacillota bacterium]